MKKLVLSMLVLNTLICNVTHTRMLLPYNAITSIKNAPRLKITDFGGWDYAKMAGLLAVANVGGWLVSSSVVGTLGDLHDVNWNYFHPSDWHFGQKLGTAVVTALGALCIYGYYVPHAGWSKDDEALVDAIITTATQAEVLATLDTFFVSERFPRAVAFERLVAIIEKLKRSKDAFIRMESRRFNGVIGTIDQNLDLLSTIILTIKSQPHWLEESNAHTLEKMKSNTQANNNAQTAQFGVALARAFTDRK